jgi:hypothetical protein
MAITPNEWVKIRAEINAAVEPLKPTGMRKVAKVLKEWGLLGILTAAVLGLFAQSYSRLGKEQYFEGQTTATLNQVNENIGGLQKSYSALRDDVTALKIQIVTLQPAAQFKAQLSQLRPALVEATQQQSKIPPQIISDLQTKLQLVGTDAPSYWPVVAQFVTFRSIAGSSWPLKNLPNCRDTKPSQANLPVSSASGQLNEKLKSYQDCRFTLDSSVDGGWINPLIVEGEVIFFTRCVVEYHGGPLEIRFDLAQNRVVDSFKHGTHAMSMSVDRTITLTDCIFQLSVDQSPSEQAKQLTTFLLTQNTKQISLPIRKLS